MRGMLIAAALLAPLPALAQTAATPAAPSVFLMPASVLGAVRQYLGGRPHDEVAGLIGALEACASLQIPGKEPKTAPAECRPVTEALAEQAKDKARAGGAEVRLSGPARSPGE